MKKLTYEEVKQNIYIKGYELVSEVYVNSWSKLIIKDVLGYYYFNSYNNLTSIRIPDKFNIYNPYTLENIKLWLTLNNIPIRLISEEYMGSGEKYLWQCLKDDCGEVFDMTWEHIYDEIGCSYCSGQRVGLSNCLATKNPELASEWLYNKNKLTPYDFTCGSGKYAWWKCKECGNEWKTKISSRSNGTGCPECNESHGEKRTKTWLINNLIIYSQQFRIKKCKNKRTLPFDFSVFDNNKNLLFLIEYDGIYHYIDKFENPKKFNQQQYNDKLKNEYCIKNNIILIRIPYWDFDNIETILEDILIKNNMNSKYIVNNKQI